MTAAANTNETSTHATLTPENLPELVEDLKAAHAAGLAAAAAVDDGGTCNFDSAVLAVGTKPERRLAAAAVKIAGGHSFEWRLFGKIAGVVVSLGMPGQANKNTRYAEAFEKHLKAKGWPTSMYYQAD